MPHRGLEPCPLASIQPKMKIQHTTPVRGAGGASRIETALSRFSRMLRHGLSAALLIAAFHPAPAHASRAALFMNGNMATRAAMTTTQIDGIRASGFNTLIIFNMRVTPTGDFTYDGTLCSNGNWVGPSDWAPLFNQCKAMPSGVTRIEMCIGGWLDESFTNIRNLVNSQGSGTNNVLYRNLQALKAHMPIDAICYDDESVYDVNSSVAFGQMIAAAGMKVTLCPYTNSGYWQAVKNGVGAACDQVYLQCYDGGAGNNPASWNNLFGGMKVTPGTWDLDGATTFRTRMESWGASAGVSDGFYWPGNTGGNPPAGPALMQQYARLIHLSLDNEGPDISGEHRMVNALNNKAIDNGSTSLGAPTVQWTVNGNNDGLQQRWMFTQNSDTSWNIINLNSGRALEMQSTANLGQPVAWSWNGGTNQRWWIDRQSDGTYKIWNQWSGKALENASSPNDGAPIVQWPWNGQTQQRWRLK